MTRMLSAWFGRRFVVATVRGLSMVPTFRHGDRVLARRRGAISVGDVVVVEPPAAGGSKLLIKRVFAVPGDPVPGELFPALMDVAERVVPPGRLVLLGDNEPLSDDSRRLGYFEVDRVLGVVLRKLPGRADLPPLLAVHPRAGTRFGQGGSATVSD